MNSKPTTQDKNLSIGMRVAPGFKPAPTPLRIPAGECLQRMVTQDSPSNPAAFQDILEFQNPQVQRAGLALQHSTRRRVPFFNCAHPIKPPKTKTGNRTWFPVFALSSRRGNVRGALPGYAPQKRCDHLYVICVPGGVIPPTVSIPSSYSSARRIASPF